MSTFSVVMPCRGYTGVKVFSATKARERAALGDRIAAWLSKRPVEIVNAEVRQSSDTKFHCLTIVLFTKEPPPKTGRIA